MAVRTGRDTLQVGGRGHWPFALLVFLWTGSALAQLIQEFPVPAAAGGPQRISQGPDGNLWFSAWWGNSISRMTPDGHFDSFPFPDPCFQGANQGCQPTRPVAGPDGAMWFGEGNNQMFGRVDMQGVLTQFYSPNAGSLDVTSGGDGALWAVLSSGGIRRWTIGSTTDYPLPPGRGQWAICTAPDGSVWFSEETAGRIGRLTTSGTLTEFIIPTKPSFPMGISAAPDGTIWFTDLGANKIGSVTPGGVFSEFPIPSPAAGPIDIAFGPDGCLWFTEYFGGRATGRIGRLDPRTGTIAEFSLPERSPKAIPWGITAGPRNRMWFTEPDGLIGSIDVAIAASAGAVSIPTTPTLGLVMFGVALAAVGMKVLSRA